MNLTSYKMPSPLGELLLVLDDEGLVRALDFADHGARFRRRLREQYGVHSLAEGDAHGRAVSIASKLERYFSGDLHALDDVDVATNGGDFEHEVWGALRKIPVGATTTYGEIAKQLGHPDPRAAIDVGAAIGNNPIAIIVPCHRVVGKGGDLKGFAGGPHRKRWLLTHENAGVMRGTTPVLPGLE